MLNNHLENEQLHDEAAVTPERSEEARQDQQGAGQSGEKSTRKPYDGSKHHGVVPKNINDVEQATKAKSRLELRLEYLNKEYAECASIIQDSEKSISEKYPAFKAAGKINEQLTKLQDVAKELKERVPQLERQIEDKILNFDPAKKVDVTI